MGRKQFVWADIKKQLAKMDVYREANGIQNRVNDLKKKYQAWDFLMNKTGCGYDPDKGTNKITYPAWLELLECFNGRYKSFRRAPPKNLDLLAVIFHRTYVTGRCSSSLATMGTNGGRWSSVPLQLQRILMVVIGAHL